MITLLLTANLHFVLAEELTCVQHFPIRESVDILNKLLAKYAVPMVTKDENGVEWMNYLIVKNDGLLVNGTRYFFNDNRLSPEMTFYFDDSLRLNSVPIFVVEKEQFAGWRSDFPDKTYALTRISRRCEYGQTACGLLCCYSETDAVQKGFLELYDTGDLSAMSTYSLNDVVYFLQPNKSISSPTCSYSLSHHDTLFRKVKIAGERISQIYFSCQESLNCCGLKCIRSSKTAQFRKPREITLQLDRRRTNVILSLGAAFSFITFVVITFVNYRKSALSTELFCRFEHELAKQSLNKQTVDTQTSRFSLEEDRKELQNLLANTKAV